MYHLFLFLSKKNYYLVYIKDAGRPAFKFSFTLTTHCVMLFSNVLVSYSLKLQLNKFCLELSFTLPKTFYNKITLKCNLNGIHIK